MRGAVGGGGGGGGETEEKPMSNCFRPQVTTYKADLFDGELQAREEEG